MSLKVVLVRDTVQGGTLAVFFYEWEANNARQGQRATSTTPDVSTQVPERAFEPIDFADKIGDAPGLWQRLIRSTALSADTFRNRQTEYCPEVRVLVVDGPQGSQSPSDDFLHRMGSPNSFALLLLLFISIPSILARSTDLSVHQAHHKRAYNLRSSARRRAVAKFAAATDVNDNAKTIFAAATASKKAGKDVVATFPAQVGDKNNVAILGDWLKLDGVSAYHFIADMDVDCDGVDFQCSGNPDGQSATSFGALNAAQVPFYVLPLKFTDAHKDIKPNALGAIICNDKIFYGIYGDQNGDDPQVIGEASIVLAQSCFPNDKLSGDNGHTPLDVLYVVFGSQVPIGVGKTTIDVAALKTLGDEQTALLAKALGGNGAAARPPVARPTAPSPPRANLPTTTTPTTVTTTNVRPIIDASQMPGSFDSKEHAHPYRDDDSPELTATCFQAQARYTYLLNSDDPANANIRTMTLASDQSPQAGKLDVGMRSDCKLCITSLPASASARSTQVHMNSFDRFCHMPGGQRTHPALDVNSISGKNSPSQFPCRMGSFAGFVVLLLSISASSALPWAGTRARAYDLAARAASSFAADSSIDVQGILAEGIASPRRQQHIVDIFPSDVGFKNNVFLMGDWLNFTGVSAYHFLADMNVDSGNTGKQASTSFGHLDTTMVPYYVLPTKFTDAHPDVKPNSLGAVVCNGQMFYGVFGDKFDGDLIGEASQLLAQSCFPNDQLSTTKSHGDLDVLYIVFGSQVPSGVGDSTIDLGALKTLGDQQAKLLGTALAAAEPIAT
ncbi:hypothetical protein EVG20_g2778 [Dentipellis fragilis]|uniref:Endo-chitosanase n=1 Tax=Dentipellis fragilis TaxID=205917 RepID=A0A4Y9Z7W8_9AGAM|nr:hypothetical protein EVG20_g2778 [Dentipellis fragilis]